MTTIYLVFDSRYGVPIGAFSDKKLAIRSAKAFRFASGIDDEYAPEVIEMLIDRDYGLEKRIPRSIAW